MSERDRERVRRGESQRAGKPESQNFPALVFRLSGFLDFRHSGFLFSYKPISP